MILCCKKTYLNLRKYFNGVEDRRWKYSQGIEDEFWKLIPGVEESLIGSLRAGSWLQCEGSGLPTEANCLTS